MALNLPDAQRFADFMQKHIPSVTLREPGIIMAGNRQLGTFTRRIGGGNAILEYNGLVPDERNPGKFIPMRLVATMNIIDNGLPTRQDNFSWFQYFP